MTVQKSLLPLAVLMFVAACSFGPDIEREQKLLKSAQTPYRDLLVVVLLDNFDARKRLEKAVIVELEKRGVSAVRSTSQMRTTTPMSRKTYLEMVENLNPEALLVIQLIDVKSTVQMKNSASPEATYNVSPTWYFNVWEVELTEYEEPKSPEFRSSYALLTEVYEVASRERVWAIESRSKITTQGGSIAQNYVLFNDEGRSQVKRLRKDGLIP